ncbi:MAG: hypothetical protein IJ311_02640 [Elusimicrobiaceae bacterium]|nr:hypothetical protein [Elusimicrobiaceae bacterium]
MGKFLLLLTNLAFPFAALGVLLGFVFSARRRVLKTLWQELQERFALEKQGEVPQGALWIHCASVGEVKSVQTLIKQLKSFYQKEVIVTTSTVAGRAEAAKNADIKKALLAPLDFYPFSRRFVHVAAPHRLFVVEREIWPNMLYAAQKAGVPVMLVNARISQKSTRAYLWVKPLFNMLFKQIALGAMQDEDAAKRYASLGLARENIAVCGNVKYDTLNDRPAKLKEVNALIKKLGWQDNLILVCGSTHPVEEELILKAAPVWADAGIKVIFAPRHLERKEEIKANLQHQKLPFALLSEKKFPKNTVLLCADTMGFLQSLYACAALSFVGGSIAPRGAHNLLEPAILGKTVLFGKSFYNTPDTAHALLASGGGVLVDATNLKATVLRLCKDSAGLENMAAKARQTALSFKGATQNIMGAVKDYERKTT